MSNKIVSLLVVDDEPDICANLSDIFSELGFHVDVAYDGPSALALMQNRPYDVALLDLRMPGMNGLELYQRIRELRVGTVALIVTAFASDATAQAALAAGAWRVIPKPVDAQSLVKLVGEAADQAFVMIIDDDPEFCDSLMDVFHDQGFRACIAHSIAQAEQRMRSANFDVAVFDLQLPEGDGRQILQKVREINPSARTVLVTGHRERLHDYLQQVLAAGVDAVCYKPFDVNVLLETVKKLTK